MIKGVMLIGVGRNLNRAVRTCYSFGVYDIYCHQCPGTVRGSLFSAKGQVRIRRIDSLSAFDRAAALAVEVTKGLPPLQNISLDGINYLVVGGESVTLRRRDWPVMARIYTINSLCLTTEAALAIALYEIARRMPP